jgi:hypothetical protein
MTRTRRIALAWILLCCGISVFWGFFLERTSPNGMGDFKAVYYHAQCLLQDRDPYKEGAPLRAYLAQGGRLPQSSETLRQALTLNTYLPTTDIFIAPFAMLPWGPAHLLWMSLTAGSLILAASLMWSCGANHASVLSGVLICLVLANSEILFAFGNAAGVAVSLCVVAVWCFLRKRFMMAGVLCLAVSLAIKPHDAGLVWLFFLLAGAPWRKRALQTLLATAVLGLSAFLWVSHVAPHWMQEWQSNLSVISAHGSVNDPGLVSVTGPLAGMVIDLQSVISVFRDDPRIYNPVSYLVCGSLLLIWLVHTLRSHISQRTAWLALAAVVPLTMLVTYHRPYDAKLLLLSVPACAMLWAKGGPVAWIALVVNSAGIVLTGDIPSTILLIPARNLHRSTARLPGQILTVLLAQPAPLILLVMSIFYLWIYVRHEPTGVATAETGEPPLASAQA